jgi:hypothetical protein
MNKNMVILRKDWVGGLHHEMSRCSAPLVLIKDRTVGGTPMFREFAADRMLW